MLGGGYLGHPGAAQGPLASHLEIEFRANCRVKVLDFHVTDLVQSPALYMVP